MNKVLILSCGTGGGHNSAARAIKEELNKRNIQADFKEYLEIINERLAKAVNKIYIKSTTGNGKIFKNVYKIGEAYDKMKIKSPVYALNSLNKKKLYKYIKDNKYNYIVTTHLFAAQALTSIKKEKDIHFIEIATDYKCIPFWKETNPDYIVIPHKDLIEDFTDKGIPKSKIKPLGIPVSSNFSEELDRQKCIKDLKLNSQNKYILIMTGSMGFGNTLEIVKDLSKKIKETIIVSCGNNKELLEKINKNLKNENVIALGYTKEISKYMRVSEVLLTKPGGLTSTEAATINIPIIHTMPIPGCENYNANFFESRGMSKICYKIDEIEKEIYNIINDSKIRKKMILNQQKYIDKEACKKICDLIIEECNNFQN